MTFRSVSDGDVETVVDLWRRCGLTRPHNDPYRDIAFARGKTASDVLVSETSGRIVASAVVGHDGHRGAVYYVSVDPDSRCSSLGRALMATVEGWMKERGVWKLNLLIREDNTAVQGFYQSLGYEVEPRTAMARRLEP